MVQYLSFLGFDQAGIAAFTFGTLQNHSIFPSEGAGETGFHDTHFRSTVFKCIPCAKQFKMKDISLKIIHISHLIQNKFSTGRTKDLADAKYLKQILELKRT